ncbi:MAG: hypothetical protein NWF01_07155 [Candidatus Bathyarchaeota archaeon]|nr:hypothetical protein [Candidatus Bathyarchaeota archaeon]
MNSKLLLNAFLIVAFASAMLSVGLVQATQVGPMTEDVDIQGSWYGRVAAYVNVYWDDQTGNINWEVSTCDPGYAPGVFQTYSMIEERNIKVAYACEAYEAGNFYPTFDNPWYGYADAWAYPSYPAHHGEGDWWYI